MKNLFALLGMLLITNFTHAQVQVVINKPLSPQDYAEVKEILQKFDPSSYKFQAMQTSEQTNNKSANLNRKRMLGLADLKQNRAFINLKSKTVASTVTNNNVFKTASTVTNNNVFIEASTVTNNNVFIEASTVTNNNVFKTASTATNNNIFVASTVTNNNIFVASTVTNNNIFKPSDEGLSEMAKLYKILAKYQ